MKTLLTTLLLVLSISAFSQIPLEKYIEQGLQNNLTLQRNNMSLKNAEYSLKVAKGMFLPSAGIQARYTLAEGGRTIEFPVGDMLNPVYNTLNQLLTAQGQGAPFSEISNESIAFMRPQEYDAKLSVVQPLYSRSLFINKKISEQQLSMSQQELEKFKRELSFQIKEAYYNYLQTVQMIQMVNRTMEVVTENLRVTQKLFESDMITKDAVLRARSDVSQVKLFKTTVSKNNELAKSYFNFLLNKDFNSSIEIGTEELNNTQGNLDNYTSAALELREELKQLDSQTEIYALLADLNTAENIPMLLLAIDAGLQGENFSNFSESDYVMGSVVLNWTLFSGNVNRNKRQQAIIEMEKSEKQKEEAIQQILLEVKRDFLDVQELRQNLEVATNRDTESKEVYRILEKRYRQGEAALVELLDARNNMVEAESDKITTKYKLLTSLAKLEKSSVMGTD